MTMTLEEIDELAERIQAAELELGHKPPNTDSLAAIKRVLCEYFDMGNIKC